MSSYQPSKYDGPTGQVFDPGTTTMPHTESFNYRDEVFPAGWNPPANAASLTFYNCTFTNMPTEWPSYLEKLDIDTCKCNDDNPWTVPETLKHLSIGFQELFPAYLPSGLQSLYLRKFFADTLPALPQGLKRLTLLRGRMTVFPEALPPTLESLHLYQSAWRSLPQLPDTLVQIILEEQYLDRYPVGSPNLIVSHDGDCAFGDRDNN